MNTPDKLDEMLSAAWDSQEGDQETAPVEVAQETEAAPTEEPVASPELEVAAQEPSGRARDDAGRFAPKPKEAAAAKPATPKAVTTPTAKDVKPATTPVAPAQEPAQTVATAPRAWKPTTREEWAKLPQPVKDQILKREGEFSRAMQEAAQAKQGYTQVQQVLQPFIPHMQAAGVHPLQYVEAVLRTDYTLRSSPQPQKAQMMAQLIQNYGVDIGQLDQALQGFNGQPSAQRPPAQQELRDPRLDKLLSEIQRGQQQRNSTFGQQAAQELEAFAGEEFYEDVKADMADLLSQASQRGKPLTLKQAYDKACLLNDDVRGTVEKRKAQEALRTQSQKAQQARYAAGSVQSEPSAPTGGKRPSMDEALWQGLNGR